jgi:16S rRNA A1518/A1519 N6-dimethyltransferase RsmA/KsgA/DIM1 with predicted DNA glycosylase/AP lyase activity
LREVVTTTFQQRRKTIRNSLKKLATSLCNDDTDRAQKLLSSSPPSLPAAVLEARDRGDEFAQMQELPLDWASKRPEELNSAQFVELTRLLYGPADGIVDPHKPLGEKVWRKLKHGNAQT